MINAINKKEPYRSGVFLAGGMVFVVLFYAIACAYLQKISLLFGIVFFLFELLCVFSIGSFLLSFLRVGRFHWIEKIALSYALGYAADIIIYFLIFPMLGKWGVMILLWLLGAASAFYLWERKRPGFNQFRISTESVMLVLLFLLVLIMLFFVGSINNASPLVLGRNTFFADQFFWISDAVSFTKQFPAVNFRNIGSPTYYYHYFSSIQLAVASVCTGIPVVSLGFSFSYMQSAILLVCSMFAFMKLFARTLPSLLTGVLFTLFTTGYEMRVLVTSVSHYFTAPFGFDIGISFGLLTLLLIYKQQEAGHFNWKLFLLTILFFFICTGSKAPVAMLIMGVIGVQCVYWLMKKNFSCAFLYGCFILLTFFLLYFFIVNGLPANDTSKTAYFLNNGMENSSIRELADVQENLRNHLGIPGETLFDLYYFLLTNPAVFIVFFIALVIKIIKIKTLTPMEAGLAILAITGAYLTRYVKMVGFSQMYFSLSAIPLAMAFSISSMETFFVGISKADRAFHVSRSVFGGLKGLLFLFGLYLFLHSNYFAPQFNSGWTKLLSVMKIPVEQHFVLCYENITYSSVYNDNNDGSYIQIDRDLSQACLWFSQNVDKDSVLSTNAIDSYSRRYAIGVLCNCWYYNDPDNKLPLVLSGDPIAVKSFLDSGVDYLVVKSGTADGLLAAESDSRLVYENEEIQILQLAQESSDR